MATYAVGDLQGCLDPLLCLLDEVDFDWQRDRLWLAGDLVNRGPQSLATLEFLFQRRHAITAVLGNHDLHLVAMAFDKRSPSRGDTLEEILRSPRKDTLISWLRTLPLVHWDQSLDYAMVHAGIAPQWTVADAVNYSAEVERVLQDDQQIDTFLSAMYGNLPAGWSEDLQGLDRLRVITNYCTRMRFVDAQGNLDLAGKGEPVTAPPGFHPWFEDFLAKPNQPKLIFGHWAALNGETHSDRVIGLDTGCVWGNAMTMLCLDDGRRWQCHCPKR